MLWFYIFIFLVIIGLIIALCIYKAKYKTMKSYYEYSVDKANSVESHFSKIKGSKLTYTKTDRL